MFGTMPRIVGAAALTTLITCAPSQAQTTSGGRAIIQTPAEKFAVAPTGVDLRTGRYVYNATDLSIGGDAGLSLVRTMTQAVPGHANPFGNLSMNWDIAVLETRIRIDTGREGGQDLRITVNYGGRTETFEAARNVTGYTQKSMGAFATLTFSGDRYSDQAVYTFVSTDGTEYSFRQIGSRDCAEGRRCGAVSRIVQPDGTVLTFDYDYNAAATGNRARLRSVVSSRGYAVLFEGAGSLISKACTINLATTPIPGDLRCPTTAIATTYGYEGDRLSSVTLPDGGVERFTYAYPLNRTEMGFIKPGTTVPWLTNTLFLSVDEQRITQEVVEKQTLVDGRIFTYLYDRTPPNDDMESFLMGGAYGSNHGAGGGAQFDFPILPGTGPLDPCGQSVCPEPQPDRPGTYQTTSGPVTVSDANGATWTNDYCDRYAMANLPLQYRNRCFVGLLDSFTDPSGVKTLLTYGAGRNVIEARQLAVPGTGLPDIVTKATYECSNAKTCNKPLTVTDARSNVTEYSYDPAHGGVLRETSPANDAGIRAVKRYSYVQRYAWVARNGPGYVRAATPVWLLNDERTCRTTATQGDTCAGGSADEVVTSYDYGPDTGPNTLLLRGVVVTADGTSRRTCYGYDRQGNRISETKPRAGLNACPAN